MSHANFSRRAIVAGAASVPALALPAAAIAVGAPGTTSLPDPVIALAEKVMRQHDGHKAACDTFFSAVKPSRAMQADWNEVCNAMTAATRELEEAVPISFAGLAAKAEAWRYLEEDNKETADDLVYSLAKDIAVIEGRGGVVLDNVASVIVAASSNPDPIFAVIEQHRALKSAFVTRCDYEDGRQGLARAPVVALVEASIAVRTELANTSPTTLPGLFAYIECVHADTDEDQFAFDPGEETAAFVRSLQRAARHIAASVREAVQS